MTVNDWVKLALIIAVPIVAAIGAADPGTVAPLVKLICVAAAGSMGSALAFTEKVGHRRPPPGGRPPGLSPESLTGGIQ